MIRTRRLPLPLLNAWLVDQGVAVPHARYRLRLWREAPEAFDPIRGPLEQYISEALDDARQHLRHGFEETLSPFNDPATDPATNYPARLNRQTLMGYLGETLAVLAVEHWGASGHDDWVVPVMLFRFHTTEIQHLGEINSRIRAGQQHNPDDEAEKRPGRTGDDALAFRRDNQNVITDFIALEAKCLRGNSNSKIEDAHAKLNKGVPPPSGINELISILSGYPEPEAAAWQEALLKFYVDGYKASTHHDGVAYATAYVKKPPRVAWLPIEHPHEAYTVANRRLEGMEFQFSDVRTLVDKLYRGV
jgi:hypothetical protein